MKTNYHKFKKNILSNKNTFSGYLYNLTIATKPVLKDCYIYILSTCKPMINKIIRSNNKIIIKTNIKANLINSLAVDSIIRINSAVSVKKYCVTQSSNIVRISTNAECNTIYTIKPKPFKIVIKTREIPKDKIHASRYYYLSDHRYKTLEEMKTSTLEQLIRKEAE